MSVNNNNDIVNTTTEESNELNVQVSEEEINKQIEEKVLAAIRSPEIRKEMLLAIKLDKDVVINGFTFASTNYSAFSELPGNRKLNSSNLQKLESSIDAHGYRSSQPVTLNEQLQTLNGQHRKYICEKKNIPIYFNFERTHTNSLELTVDMNISQRNWDLQDYVQSYADRGFKDYINILKLTKDQGISLSLSLWLVYHSRNGHVQELVKTGQLKCGDRDIKMVEKTLALIKEIRDTIPNNLPHEKALRNAFLGDKISVPLSVLIEEPNYSQARMVKQIGNYYKSIDKRNMSSCGDSLVSIYNYRLKDAKSRLRAYNEIGKID